ncbi:MAG: hypothetical protein ACRBF0_04850 [Calditrichia bacterium]
MLWIMIAGPYRSGTVSEEERKENLEVMNRYAVEVFRKGHVPVIGVNNALPMIEVAGEVSYEELMMPISLALADRCDACLRVGGESVGADQEVEKFRSRKKPVYYALEEVPEL